MPQYDQVNGVLCQSKPYVNTAGALREGKESYDVVGGVLHKYYSGGIALGSLPVGTTVYAAGVPYTIVAIDHHLQDANYPADCVTLWCEECTGSTVLANNIAGTYTESSYSICVAKTAGLGALRQATTVTGHTSLQRVGTVTGILSFPLGIQEMRASGLTINASMTQNGMGYFGTNTSSSANVKRIRYVSGAAVVHWSRDGFKETDEAGDDIRGFYGISGTGMRSQNDETDRENSRTGYVFPAVNLLKTVLVSYNAGTGQYEIIL